MRRKTDFFTYEDKAHSIVKTHLDENMRVYKEAKAKEAALKKKQEEEK